MERVIPERVRKLDEDCDRGVPPASSGSSDYDPWFVDGMTTDQKRHKRGNS